MHEYMVEGILNDLLLQANSFAVGMKVSVLTGSRYVHVPRDTERGKLRKNWVQIFRVGKISPSTL